MSVSGWAQRSKDSVLSDIKNLKETRAKLTKKLSQLKDSFAENDSILNDTKGRFDNMLVTLDSLWGEQNLLQKENPLSKTDQKRLVLINKRVNEIKTRLNNLAPQVDTLEANRIDMLTEIDNAEKLIDQLDQKIKQLESRNGLATMDKGK